MDSRLPASTNRRLTGAPGAFARPGVSGVVEVAPRTDVVSPMSCNSSPSLRSSDVLAGSDPSTPVAPYLSGGTGPPLGSSLCRSSQGRKAKGQARLLGPKGSFRRSCNSTREEIFPRSYLCQDGQDSSYPGHGSPVRHRPTVRSIPSPVPRGSPQLSFY